MERNDWKRIVIMVLQFALLFLAGKNGTKMDSLDAKVSTLQAGVAFDIPAEGPSPDADP
jgi:outer membrane murein-binding lipoprotein Lpp